MLLVRTGEGEIRGDHHVELVAGPYLDGRRSVHPAADTFLSDRSELCRCAAAGLLSGHREGAGLGVAVWPVGSTPSEGRHLPNLLTRTDEAHEGSRAEGREVVIVDLVGNARETSLIGRRHLRQVDARGGPG
jgi:hypothetical protein